MSLDCDFWPTPATVVAAMLELAAVGPGDIVYDLGCGDGRIVIAAAELGARAAGIDLDPVRVRQSLDAVSRSGQGERVAIRCADMLEVDLRPASVVALYVGPELGGRLLPQLRRLAPGSRIVSHRHGIPGTTPTREIIVPSAPGFRTRLFLWRVPWSIDKPLERNHLASDRPE